MYVKVVNNEVDTFPYTVSALKRELSNVSFPKTVGDDILASYGVYPVVNTAPPDFDSKTHKLVEGVVSENGTWKRTWTKQALSSTMAASNNRAERNRLLKDTDVYGLSDVTMSSEMTTYRQALRDLPTHANWPFLNESDWPTKP